MSPISKPSSHTSHTKEWTTAQWLTLFKSRSFIGTYWNNRGPTHTHLTKHRLPSNKFLHQIIIKNQTSKYQNHACCRRRRRQRRWPSCIVIFFCRISGSLLNSCLLSLSRSLTPAIVALQNKAIKRYPYPRFDFHYLVPCSLLHSLSLSRPRFLFLFPPHSTHMAYSSLYVYNIQMILKICAHPKLNESLIYHHLATWHIRYCF